MPKCLMTNCSRTAPIDEAMCKGHRDDCRLDYKRLRDRLISDLLVDIPLTSHYGRLISKSDSTGEQEPKTRRLRDVVDDVDPPKGPPGRGFA